MENRHYLVRLDDLNNVLQLMSSTRYFCVTAVHGIHRILCVVSFKKILSFPVVQSFIISVIVIILMQCCE